MMENKKNPQLDLKKKSPFFFNLGMIVSLALVMMAFEWKFYDNLNKITLDPIEDNFTAMEDIPITKIETPPPPKVVTMPEITEVENDVKVEEILIDLNPEIKETNNTPVIIVPTVPEQPQEPEVEDTFLIVETQPEPDGGMGDFYKYLSKEIDYPKQARRMGVEGRVFVQFVVDKDGSLTDLKVLKGIGAGCDEEAIRVLKTAPKWKPGKQRGRAVKVRMSIPIFFKLG